MAETMSGVERMARAGTAELVRVCGGYFMTPWDEIDPDSQRLILLAQRAALLALAERPPEHALEAGARKLALRYESEFQIPPWEQMTESDRASFRAGALEVITAFLHASGRKE